MRSFCVSISKMFAFLHRFLYFKYSEELSLGFHWSLADNSKGEFQTEIRAGFSRSFVGNMPDCSYFYNDDSPLLSPFAFCPPSCTEEGLVLEVCLEKNHHNGVYMRIRHRNVRAYYISVVRLALVFPITTPSLRCPRERERPACPRGNAAPS